MLEYMCIAYIIFQSIIYNKNAKVAVFVGNSVCFICFYKGNSNVKIQTMSKVKHLIYLSRHIVLNTNNIQINQIGIENKLNDGFGSTLFSININTLERRWMDKMAQMHIS